MTGRIAIVDDDPILREAVSRYLDEQGFEVLPFESARALREAMPDVAPDLVLLDLVMPEEDGLSLLRWLRDSTQLPVIMLTGKDDITDRVVGLELGADDYVAKPCDMRELLARIRSVIRRSTEPVADEQGVVKSAPAPGSWFGRWRLDRQRHRLVDSGGEVCSVTAHEYALLAAFADHPQVVLSRERLLELSGTDPAEVFDRAVDLRITRLRKKIEPVPGDPTVIKTIRGHGGGYEYVPSEQPDYGR